MSKDKKDLSVVSEKGRMTPMAALENLDKICAGVNGGRELHLIILESVRVLKEELDKHSSKESDGK